MRKLIKLLRREAGFTLIEVIVAVTILGIVIVPISMIFTGALNDNLDAKEKLKGTQLAQLFVESIKMKSEKELTDFFLTYPDGKITSGSAYINGFPDVPNGFTVILSTEKDFPGFVGYTAPSTAQINCDFELVFDQSSTIIDAFNLVTSSGEWSCDDIMASLELEDSQYVRNIYIIYQNDGFVYIAPKHDLTENYLYNPTPGSPSFPTIPNNNRQIMLTMTSSDLYSTRVHIYDYTATSAPIEVFITNRAYDMSGKFLQVENKSSVGKKIVKVRNFYETDEIPYKIYKVNVKVLNEHGEIIADLDATKTDK